MSEGPIKAWRDAWKPPRASTSASTSMHMQGSVRGQAYCGRRTGAAAMTSSAEHTSCADCLAAYAADHPEARS